MLGGHQVPRDARVAHKQSAGETMNGNHNRTAALEAPGGRLERWPTGQMTRSRGTGGLRAVCRSRRYHLARISEGRKNRLGGGERGTVLLLSSAPREIEPARRKCATQMLGQGQTHRRGV